MLIYTALISTFIDKIKVVLTVKEEAHEKC